MCTRWIGGAVVLMLAFGRSLIAGTTQQFKSSIKRKGGVVFSTDEKEMERRLRHAAAPSAFISAPEGIIYDPIRP